MKRKQQFIPLCILTLYLSAGCSNGQTSQAPIETPTVKPATPVVVPSITPTETTTVPGTEAVSTNIIDSLPPGLYIVYWSQYTWFIQGIDGSDPIKLAPIESRNSQALLSPDQTMMAFVDSQEQVSAYSFITGELRTFPNPFPELKLIELSGWSPDSQVLLYTGTPSEMYISDWTQYGIYAINVENRETGCLIQWNSEFSLGGNHPSWSPDGHWIAFIGLSNTRELYIMDARCTEDFDTCKDRTVLKSSNCGMLTWSPGGKLASDCEVETHFGLYIFDVNDVGIPNRFYDLDDIVFRNFSWSSDNRHIGMSILRQNENGEYFWDVFTLSTLEDQIKNLTNTPSESEWFNGWSPDGKLIAFTRIFDYETEYDRKYATYHPIGDIYIASPDGGEDVNITNTENVREDFSFWLEVK